jgi:hypothetical protein
LHPAWQQYIAETDHGDSTSQRKHNQNVSSQPVRVRLLKSDCPAV